MIITAPKNNEMQTVITTNKGIGGNFGVITYSTKIEKLTISVDVIFEGGILKRFRVVAGKETDDRGYGSSDSCGASDFNYLFADDYKEGDYFSGIATNKYLHPVKQKWLIKMLGQIKPSIRRECTQWYKSIIELYI